MIRMGHDTCPHCGAICDAATAVKDNAVPKPGDLSICFKCGGFLQYGSDMALQELPKVVFETLEEETRQTLLKAQYLIRHPK